MNTKLKISYDGDSESIRAGRLSVAEFGQSFVHLLSAVRRTASAVASGNDGRVTLSGSIADVARQMDIQITGISDGSINIQSYVVDCSPTPDTSLFSKDEMDRLPEKTMLRMLEDMEAESKGKARNEAIRKYLGELPKHVKSQQYTLAREDEILMDLSVTEMDLIDGPIALPTLERITGKVTALCVEEGKESVSIRSKRKRWTLSADPELVQKAYELKTRDVFATIVVGVDSERLSRLIRLDERVPEPPPPEERLDYISKSWDEALAELAK